MWDGRSLGGKPLATYELDQAAGVMIPFYDEDTRMLYLTGKVSVARDGECVGMIGSALWLTVADARPSACNAPPSLACRATATSAISSWWMRSPSSTFSRSTAPTCRRRCDVAAVIQLLSHVHHRAAAQLESCRCRHARSLPPLPPCVIQGADMLPKRSLNVMKCEVARMLKLTGDSVEPLSFIVPRKSEAFQEDIFPDTAAGIPSLTAAEWFSGKTAEPKKVSLDPSRHGAVSGGASATYTPVAASSGVSSRGAAAGASPVKTAPAAAAPASTAATSALEAKIAELTKELAEANVS